MMIKSKENIIVIDRRGRIHDIEVSYHRYGAIASKNKQVIIVYTDGGPQPEPPSEAADYAEWVSFYQTSASWYRATRIRIKSQCEDYFDARAEANFDNLFYVIAVVLLIGWFFGAFVYHLTGEIHSLLVLAVLTVLLRIIRGDANAR